jgi:recombinational DNA repair protein RecR
MKMTTLNIEKSTRERLNALRRDCRTYDDIVNRLIDEITTLEGFLPYWPCRIDQFNKCLSQTENVSERLEQVLDNKKTFLNTCSKCGNVWESYVSVNTCKTCEHKRLESLPLHWRF